MIETVVVLFSNTFWKPARREKRYWQSSIEISLIFVRISDVQLNRIEEILQGHVGDESEGRLFLVEHAHLLLYCWTPKTSLAYPEDRRRFHLLPFETSIPSVRHILNSAQPAN